jgi:hypothetical protein
MKKTWEKKFAKNCTLFHVVNKAVWADIGAASTSSTNILVLRTSQHQYIGAQNIVAPIYWCCNGRGTNILVLLVPAAPIGEDTQTFYNLKISRIFKCLQRQYIGANRFAAPIYWRSTRRTKLFAAPRLFGQTIPIQSAGASGSRK